MRILVFGAGAVGGYVGGILAAAGKDVTLVARGAQYEALAEKGVVLEGPKSGRPHPIRVRVCRPGEEKPPYDLIFVGLKSHQIADAAAHMVRLLAPDGSMILGQNGLPYWYFEKLDSPLRGSRLASVDPDGRLANTIPIDTVVGGVTIKPASLVEPGRIRLADQPVDRLVIGELDGQITPRLQQIESVFESTGWPVLVTDDIRLFKWRKLLANGAFNPLSALTQSSAREIAGFPATRGVARDLINEIISVAASVGVALDVMPDDVLDNMQKRVEIPSSTLQDVRAGRAMELGAIIDAVIDIGRLSSVPTPGLEIVAACAALLNRRIVQDGVGFAPRRPD